MPVEFKLPELGENIEKGDIVRVLVAVGDVVKPDQSVIELETDKATIEVPTSVGGTVAEVKVKVGDKVKVGQTVLVFDGTKDAKEEPAKSAKDEPAKSTKEEPAKSTKEEPAESTKDEPAPKTRAEVTHRVAEAQSEPKPASKPAEVVDITSARHAPAAAPARVEAPMADRGAAAASAMPIEAAAMVPAAPSVRRYARELGVEIGAVPGSGPGGRIGQEDVKQHVKTLLAGGGAARMRTAPLPDFSKWGAVETRPMSNIRRKTAEHLSIAWQAPHVTQHDKADITALDEFRKSHGARVEKAGGKLTVTAILIKVVTLAIDRFPQFASSADLASETLVFKKYRHIGVAVDTPNGLLVPVIRDTDRKTITEIAVELAALSQKARDRKLSLDEMAGGVFSISNLGGIGGTSFTPIVNQPEVAILGVSRGGMEPVWQNGAFVPREMLPLSLSYDHRVIDGADAARFLRFVAEGLEQPLSLML